MYQTVTDKETVPTEKPREKTEKRKKPKRTSKRKSLLRKR